VIARAVMDERDGPLPALLLALTMLAGVVDATSILRLGNVFVATMTGNLVFLGLAAAGAKGFAVVTSAIAIGGFVTGSVVGGQAYRAGAAHRGRGLRNVLAVKSLLAAGVTLAAVLTGGDFGVGVRDLVVVLLSMSMGAQLAAVRYLMIADLPTVALTMTITSALTDRAHRRRDPAVLRRVLAVLAFIAGAVAGTLLVRFVAVTAALALGLVIILAVAVAAHLLSRSEAGWVVPQAPARPLAPRAHQEG
jgi:uncharacterized membrane protein YoaK (UPF0700 family)